MIRRPHRVTFRLSATERQELTALRGYSFKWDDSEVIREAIKRMSKQKAEDEAHRAAGDIMVNGKWVPDPHKEPKRPTTPASSDKPAIAARPKGSRRQTKR